MLTVNNFIKELQNLSEETKKLPLVITSPNGLQFEPKIKLQTENGLPLAGDKPDSIVITWED